MADNTMCGKAFSKLDSLRRHVNELHKGVRPFACNVCEKNYGRRDYLDRHLRTHDPENQKKKSVTGNLKLAGQASAGKLQKQHHTTSHFRFRVGYNQHPRD